MTRTGEGEDTRGARGCPIAFKASRVPYPNTPQAALSLEGVGPSWSCLLLDRLARPDGRPSKGLSSSCAGREAVVACLQHTTGAVRHCCNYNKAVVAYLHISNTPLWNFQGAVLGVLEWRVSDTSKGRLGPRRLISNTPLGLALSCACRTSSSFKCPESTECRCYVRGRTITILVFSMPKRQARRGRPTFGLILLFSIRGRDGKARR